MLYFSTNRRSPKATFREAVLNGQPHDRGLYFPEAIPKLSPEFAGSFKELPNREIAFEVIKPYAGDSIPDIELRRICAETVDFPFPLVPVTDRISSLELFHGPTLAFKDVGARFMSRCLRYFSDEHKTVVIVATSGDTGGAVAAGFHGVDNVEVVILYPKGKVSRVQELQLTTLDGNVTAFEVDGTFDDCQAMAKNALADPDLKAKANLTSANSINVGRWLPQQFYYFFALKQWISDEPPVISVPSGNLGNIAAGIVAHLSGLPVKKFIAACNANDVVPRFFAGGSYQPKPSVATLSNAMDIGDPSNFVRMLEMFDKDFDRLKGTVESVSISDEITKQTIRDVYQTYGYMLDPHGAIGFAALADHLDRDTNEKGIFLETAHPVKFDSVARILDAAADPPESVKELFNKQASSIEIAARYDDLKQILAGKL